MDNLEKNTYLLNIKEITKQENDLKYQGEILSKYNLKLEFSNYISETKITHSIIIRYLNKVDINMRIVYNDRKFTIKSIINMDEKNKYNKILCEETI